jgi:1-deoxy-D-xylulose-5-phosphate synthase
VLTLASDEGLIDGGLKLRTLRLPDRFQDHDKPEAQYAEAGLDADAMVATVLAALRRNSVGLGAAG